jgi:DNA-binding HxlR family transcriptional regulator
MKSHGQFCPVAQALEVVGDRWTLLVVRELLSGSHRFSEILHGNPRIPRSMLAQRLKQLEDTGLVDRFDEGTGVRYELTEAGAALEGVVLGLGLWSRRWAHRRLREEELDATLLLWDMRRRVDHVAVPKERILVRFDFSDGPRGDRRLWLKIENGEADVCLTHPGFEETLVVRTSRRNLAEVWMGHRRFDEAVRSNAVMIEGPGKLARAFPRWFQLNVFVELEESA